MSAIAVVGSRSFGNDEMVRELVRRIHHDLPDWEIVSGGAEGPDKAAEGEASGLGMRVASFRATQQGPETISILEVRLGPGGYVRLAVEWPSFAKYEDALFFRNMIVVDRVERVVAFWDGISSGTAFTIGYARDRGLPVTIWKQDGTWER